MSKKSKGCEGNDGMGYDRLSGMPDEVIVRILTLMPTQDAVGTMLLRRFGDLWTLLPALTFDYVLYTTRMVWVDSIAPSDCEAFSRFACFVQNVLMLHRRPTIDAFHLSFNDGFEDEFDEENSSDYPKKMIAYVQMWLRFALGKDVKHLYFNCVAFDFLRPPRCLFTSQSLATLTLSGCCMLEHQSETPYLKNLRKLSLIRGTGSTKAYDQLIYGCPSLQELVVYPALDPGLHVLNINAPSVSRLCLTLRGSPCTLNCPRLKILEISIFQTSPLFQLSMIGVVSLQQVNLKYLPVTCSSALVKTLFRLIQSAELFTLSSSAFERISCIEKMEFSQNSWKRVVLHPQGDSERCLGVILKLIKCSVNLEELVIDAGQSRSLRVSGSSHEIGNRDELCTCVMPLLKTVTIHGNYGYEEWCKWQLQVIKFLLGSTIILEKLVINVGESKLTAVEELDLVKQVLGFRRASTNATVIIA